MLTTKILINSVEKVKQFSSIVSKQNVECEIVEGIYIIDAKSIMGIFSIDLSAPVELRIHSDDKAILDSLTDFIAQEA
uniref:HPr family phosphocarrier protein n=1 Tax=Faecalispora anaeroviscerum TaxID=2991836 RepID=UPI002DD66D02|nr:HPr family phosphocarrier protein [Faecalispora anaeroviscerum]